MAHVETISDHIRRAAAERPRHPAFILGDERLDYATLDALLDRIAASLQAGRFQPTDTLAICAATSIRYAALFLGAVRAGVAVAPLSPSARPETIVAMATDAQARLLFVDAAHGVVLADAATRVGLHRAVLESDGWLAPVDQPAKPVTIEPDWPFDVIYSSGTTGAPKGIVQPHGMRAVQLRGGSSTLSGYGPGSITLLSTPLYSNTTLVSFFSTLSHGGTVVLMPKFEAGAWLELAERHRVTHTMLVPVQYARLMAHPDFDRFDLSSFVTKQSTSAPFAAALKAEVIRRWPGKLVDSYGMTEGGGTCILEAHAHLDKLHTVGRPAAGHDIRLIDDDGREVPPGGTGEVVGHSRGMMTGYRGLPEATAAAEWFDPSGRRFIRTGDIGRFDADGFLVIVDRKKDMIISGGFNLYPSDLEAELLAHPDVAEAAVVGVPSARWGETPVGFVVPRAGRTIDPRSLLAWVNERLGKMQRLSSIELLAELPRSPIGKVMKRELRSTARNAD